MEHYWTTYYFRNMATTYLKKYGNPPAHNSGCGASLNMRRPALKSTETSVPGEDADKQWQVSNKLT